MKTVDVFIAGWLENRELVPEMVETCLGTHTS